MKNIFFSLFITLFLVGCGGSDTTKFKGTSQKTTNIVAAKISASATAVESGQIIKLRAAKNNNIKEYQWWDEKGVLLSRGSEIEWTAPSIADTYTITLSVIDTKNNYTHKSVNIVVTNDDSLVINPTNNRSFNTIQTLISQANQGNISNVTYICIGDSTRADSKHNGEHLFNEIQDKLRSYNVTSYLLARAGHEATQFNNATAFPTWQDAVSRIPGDGASTIVDISLGINDYWDHRQSAIKPHIKSAIAKIRGEKPQTHFVLSMPNRVFNNEEMTNDLTRIYKELSRELNLPLNHIIDGVMPTQASTSYSWYNDDGFNVHMSQSGQHLVAQYILGNILP